MSDDELQRDMQRRGIFGVLLLAVPILAILVVGIAYAVMFWFGAQGREATGPRAQMQFAGCPEALPLVEARVRAMGLPELVTATADGGFTVTARLPEDPRQLERIPATLARRGLFEVRAGEDGEVLLTNDDLTSASVEAAFLDVPHTRLELGREGAVRLSEHMKAHLEGSVTAWIDGEEVWSRRNLPAIDEPAIDLDLVDLSDRERLDFAAETAIILQHGPLPCEVEARDVQVVAPGDA